MGAPTPTAAPILETPLLCACSLPQDLARTWRVAQALDYGMIGCNEVAITDAAAPFGGMKESGLGREQSKYGITEFLEVRRLRAPRAEDADAHAAHVLAHVQATCCLTLGARWRWVLHRSLVAVLFVDQSQSQQ